MVAIIPLARAACHMPNVLPQSRLPLRCFRKIFFATFAKHPQLAPVAVASRPACNVGCGERAQHESRTRGGESAVGARVRSELRCGLAVEEDGHFVASRKRTATLSLVAQVGWLVVT